MTREYKISYELLRTLAENAFDKGENDLARTFAQSVDKAMLEALQLDEGREISADEVSLIVPADRA